MTEKEHKKNVEVLKSLEAELVNLIAETENEILQNKLLQWQSQRNICNEGFVKYLTKSMK